MRIIGITSLLSAEADRLFHGGFRAWLGEIRRGSWIGWSELLRCYPDACRTGGNRAHFPLAANGGGVEAVVSFPSDPTRSSMIRLLRICPAPAAAVIPARKAGHKISKPLVS